MMIDNKDVRADLEILADQLDASNENAARRLRELAYAIDGGTHADAWATTDLHRMIETEAIVQRYKRMQKTDTVIAIIELIRNALIFLPLIVTWYGVYLAVTNYHDLIRDKPDLASLPFLYLWQGGFDNRLHSWQTLGFLAAIDFGILFIVFILTVVVSFLSSLVRAKREQEAEELQDKLVHTLSRATLCLNTRNWTQPTNFIDRFDQTTKQFKTVIEQLVEQIKQECTMLSALATRQKQDSETFMTFKNDLNLIMNTVSTAVKEMQVSNKTLSHTIDTLVAPTKQIATQQGILMTTAQDAVSQFKKQIVAQDKIVEQQQLWGSELQRILNMLDGTVQQGKELAASSAGFTNQQVGFLEAIKQEREQQVQMANRMFISADNLRHIVDLINQCLVEWQGVNVNMYELIKRIATR